MEKVNIACSGNDVLDVDLLQPFQGNLKVLSEENYQKLKAEILELGFSEPVSVWKNKDKHLILNGHQRVKTLKKMKQDGYLIPKIPVSFIYANSIKEAKKKVLALTSQYGEMKAQGLYDFMQEAELELGDLDNFRLPEIKEDAFIEEYFKSQKDDSPEPPVNTPPETAEVTSSEIETNRVYEVNGHRLLLGDSTSTESVSTLFGSLKADLLLTDPPYGVDLSDKNKMLNSLGGRHTAERRTEHIAGDAQEVNYREMFKSFLSLTPLAEVSSCYVFMSSNYLHELRNAIDELGYKFGDYLCWIKNAHSLTRKDYDSKLEHIAYFWKNTHKFYAKEHRTNVLMYDRLTKNELHISQKPVQILSQLVTDGSEEGSIVYDPFLGSGSTMQACHQNRRRCFGIEIDRKHFETAYDRIKNNSAM